MSYKRLKHLQNIKSCADFVWERVNTLYSSWYGTMFWICAENSIDDTERFLLLQSSAYAESRPILLLTLPHQWVAWRYTRSWERIQPGQLTPADQRDIPCHTISCSAYKTEGRRKWGTFGVTAFVFPSNHYKWWSRAFLKMAEHLPADGK